MQLSRLYIFFFGATSCWLAGSVFPYAYRNFLWGYFRNAFGYMYTWYNAQPFDVLKPIYNTENTEYEGYISIINQLLIIVIVLFILAILNIFFLGEQNENKKVGTLVGSIKLCIVLGFAFPFLIWGIAQLNQHRDIVEEVRDGNTWQYKNKPRYFINVAVAIWVLVETLVFIYRVYQSANNIFKEHISKRFKYSVANTKNQIRQSQKIETTGFKSRVGTEAEKPEDNSRKGCSITDIYNEIAFMFIDKKKAVKNQNTYAVYYNSHFLIKWAAYAGISMYFIDYPITAYLIYCIVDVIFVIFTVMSMKEFIGFTGALILANEVVLLLWHSIMFALLLDNPYIQGEGKINEQWVKFLVLCVFVLFCLAFLVEIILGIIAAFGICEP